MSTQEAIAPVLVSVEDAASALGVRRTTAWELIRRGDLRSLKIGQRRLVEVEAIQQYVERLRNGDA
ncbi:MAG: helix-turn-helix domain-containing protein [Dehalococcoidia bacterium]